MRGLTARARPHPTSGESGLSHWSVKSSLSQYPGKVMFGEECVGVFHSTFFVLSIVSIDVNTKSPSKVASTFS